MPAERLSMANYACEDLLHFTLEVLRLEVPSVRNIRLARVPGPFRPGNWRIEWIEVLAEDYGLARDIADLLEIRHDTILIPNGHPLDGQVYGREKPVGPGHQVCLRPVGVSR